MKAVAEAIIELARDSRYVGGTVTEKSITPRPRSIQRSFRIGCATQKLFIRHQKEGRSTEDPFSSNERPEIGDLLQTDYPQARRSSKRHRSPRCPGAFFGGLHDLYILRLGAPRRGTMPATEGEPGLTHDRTAW